jgi:Flavin containing amine oxidoreductase
MIASFDDGSPEIPGGIVGQVERVLVIGAGIAGLAVANALAHAAWPRRSIPAAAFDCAIGRWLSPADIQESLTGVIDGYNEASTTQSSADTRWTSAGWVTGMIADALGSPCPEPVAIAVTEWAADPYAAGAYTHVPPGSANADLTCSAHR